MSFFYDFAGISTYITEYHDHTLVAYTDIGGKTIQRPVKTNFSWGPDKLTTLNQLILDGQLEYEFIEHYFMLTDTSLLPRKSLSMKKPWKGDNEDPDVDLAEMFRVCQGMNCEAELRGEKLTKFEVRSVDADLGILDMQHQEKMQILTDERKVAKLKRDSELNSGLSSIRHSAAKQVALNKAINDEEVNVLTMNAEEEMKEETILTAKKKQQIQEMCIERQKTTDLLKVRSACDLAKVNLECKQELEMITECNRQFEARDRQDKEIDKTMMGINRKRSDDKSSRCFEAAMNRMKLDDQRKTADAKRQFEEEKQRMAFANRREMEKFELSKKAREGILKATEQEFDIAKHVQAEEEQLFIKEINHQTSEQRERARNAHNVAMAEKERVHKKEMLEQETEHKEQLLRIKYPKGW